MRLRYADRRDAMFYYEYPKFEKKHLLTTEMLEQLRDHPRYYSELLFYGYGNGIVNGCGLSWEENRLTVDKGILYWNGNLYFMKEPYTLDCFPEDQLRYLKVNFLEEEKKPGKICGGTSIYLSKEPVDSSCEMELCRFRLQVGARLRNSYQDFCDYSTDYDTINIICAPFSDNNGSTISPKILLQFANEMMETQMTDPYEISFVMNILANHGKIGSAVIDQFLSIALVKKVEVANNQDLYQGLLNTLRMKTTRKGNRSRDNQGKKSIMLL